MFTTKVIAFLTFVGIIYSNSGLVKLSNSSSEISATEAIRDVTNRIFFNLHLQKTNGQRINEYSKIHRYFVSLTRQRYEDLKEAAKQSRPDYNIDNTTIDFTTIINNVLTENSDSGESIDVGKVSNDEVVKYVDDFLQTLATLKETFLSNNTHNAINEEILLHFTDDDKRINNTLGTSEYESSENSTDENEFWEPMQDTRRIYRGQRTKVKYFPFMASIQIFNQFQCGGSIIKSDLIITAASCVQLAYNNRFFRENPAFLSVRVGSDFYNGGGENIQVLEVYFRHDYNPKTLKNNLALLRLVRHLRFKKKSRKIKKIDFDRSPFALPVTTDGITIIGWGARTTSNKVQDPWTNKIMYAVLDVYALEECQDVYSKEYVTRKHFCAGFLSTGGGACNRDVGDPGISGGKLLGVVSFGSPGCGAIDAPTVFTKIGYYADWIEEIMEQDVPSGYMRTTTRMPWRLPTIPFSHMYETTTFKIEPIVGKMTPIPIQSIDNLRTDPKKLFAEFLNTMFNSKERLEYKDLIKFQGKEIDTLIDKLAKTLKNDKPKNEVNAIRIDKPHHENKAEKIETDRETDESAAHVTVIGDYDPRNDKRPAESLSGEDIKSYTAINENEREDAEKEVLDLQEDEEEGIQLELPDQDEQFVNTEELEQVSKVKPATDVEIDAEPEQVEVVNQSVDVEQTVEHELNKKKNLNYKIQNKPHKTDTSMAARDFELEKQIDRIIDKLDIDDIVTPDKLTNKNIIEESKLLEMMETGREKKKLKKADDAILTLLYLSDNEKKKSNLPKRRPETKKPKKDHKFDYKNEGLSIDSGGFADFTYRMNQSVDYSEIMTKKELFEILAEAIDPQEN